MRKKISIRTGAMARPDGASFCIKAVRIPSAVQQPSSFSWLNPCAPMNSRTPPYFRFINSIFCLISSKAGSCAAGCCVMSISISIVRAKPGAYPGKVPLFVDMVSSSLVLARIERRNVEKERPRLRERIESQSLRRIKVGSCRQYAVSCCRRGYRSGYRYLVRMTRVEFPKLSDNAKEYKLIETK